MMNGRWSGLLARWAPQARRQAWRLALVSVLCAVPAHGQPAGVPDIGILMGQSRDAKNVQSGCNIKWNVDTWEFECGTEGGGGGATPTPVFTPTPGCPMGCEGGGGGVSAPVLIEIALAKGKTTTITDANVQWYSQIQCGCTLGDSHYASCSAQGAWVPRLRLTSVSAGSFVLSHSWAKGGEQFICAITTSTGSTPTARPTRTRTPTPTNTPTP